MISFLTSTLLISFFLPPFFSTFFCMGTIVYARMDIDYMYSVNKLLSYTVFNVTGNKEAEEGVYVCSQPDLEWSKAFLSLLSYGKAKDCL